MANKSYSGEYNYEQMKDMADWGKGNDFTGNLPIRGEHVQRLIEDKIGKKIGCIKQVNDDVCAFSSQDTYELYLQYIASGKTEEAEALIINKWQGVKANVIALTVTDPETSSKVLLYGTEGIYLTFYFDTVDQAGTHTISEQADAVITIKKNSTVNGTIKKTCNNMETVKIQLDDYLQVGDNTVTIDIVGQETGAETNRTFTYTLVQMTFLDSFDISTVYNLTESTIMQVPISVTAPSTSVDTEFVIDGDTAHKTTLTQNSPGGTTIYQDIDISDLAEGTHTLQMASKCKVGNDVFATDIHYREFIVRTSTESIPYVAVSNTIPTTYGEEPEYVEEGGAVILYDVVQYASNPLNFTVYCYNRDTTYCEVYLNDEKVSEYDAVNNNIITCQLYPKLTGSNTVYINVYDEEKSEIVLTKTIGPFIVSESEVDINPVTSNLVCDLTARNRSNKDANRAIWTDGRVTGTLINFDWSDTSGWDSANNQLIVGNGNEVDIDYKPFSASTVTGMGRTFILEFSTDNVSDDDTIVCDMLDDGYGLCITASEMFYNFGQNEKAVTTKFASGELNRVAIVIQKANASNKQMIYLYVNGIISAAYKYNPSAFEASKKSISFVGSETAQIHIKELKIHNYAYNSDEIVNDYILSREKLYDQRDSEGNLTDRGMISLYEENNIYENGASVYPDAGTILYNTNNIENSIPVFYLTGRAGKDPDSELSDGIVSIHELEDENTSKDKWVFLDVNYVNTQHPELNFCAEKARFKIQGTSSLNYTKKNYKMSTNTNKYASKVWTGATCTEKNDEDLCPTGAFSFKVAKDDSSSLTEPGVGLKKSYPVYTYVLKADCSDSSSAHNTGAARMWNELFKNFTVNGDQVGMTKAQILAENNGWEYDVRTCVDGFPVVIFYREKEGEDWEFIGKYNFNNDKGTPETYGFEGISSSLASRTHVYELLDSANAYALGLGDMSQFLSYTTSGAGKEMLYNYTWMAGFESRYPEQPDNEWSDKYQMNKIKRFVDNGALTELKAFYDWLDSCRYDDEAVIKPGATLTITSYSFPERSVTGTLPDTKTNRKRKFYAEKWDHFDIYKMAAYYIYLMRYGAVDQVVKNAIFMTDGNSLGTGGSDDETKPSQWFYINYDNDTILGSRNDGRLAYGPYIERNSESQEESGSTQKYAYAGDKSIIWNQLNDDSEFLSALSLVDNALVKAGLSYSQMIYYFNTLQSEKWPARIYNRDQYYKYLSAYMNKNISADIPLLQGSRMAHRKWWVNKRFALYDSRYISGEYANRKCDFKVTEDVQKGYYKGKDVHVYVTPGAKVYYAWMIQRAGNPVMQTGLGFDGKPFVIALPSSALTVGNYVDIYASESIASIDVSECMQYMTSIDTAAFYDAAMGTKLKTLKIGNTENALAALEAGDMELYATYLSCNTGFTSLDFSLSSCTSLEYLDIYGMQYLSDIDLTNLKYLKTFRAWASLPSSIKFANGSPIELAEISSKCRNLELDSLNKLTKDNIKFEDGGKNLARLTIKNCQYLSPDYQFVFDWHNNKTVLDENSSLTLEGFTWGTSTSGFNLDLVDELISLGNIATLSLNGTIYIQSISSEQYYKLVEIFGEDVFDQEGKTTLKIRLNAVKVFVKMQDITYEDNEYQLSTNLVAVSNLRVDETTYSVSYTYDKTGINKIPSVDSIDSKTGKFTSAEVGYERYTYTRCTVKVTNMDNGQTGTTTGEAMTHIYERQYPESVKISCDDSATALTETDKVYEFTIAPNPDITNEEEHGEYDILWELEESPDAGQGGVYFKEHAYIVEGTETASTCQVRVKDITTIKGILNLTLTAHPRHTEEYLPPISACTASKGLIIKDKNSLISIYENPVMYEICVQAGLTPVSSTYMTYDEAHAVEDVQISAGTEFWTRCKGNTAITEFNAFREFTKLTVIPEGLFSGCSNMVEIGLPQGNLETIEESAFEGCSKLTDYRTGEYLTKIENNAFKGCTSLTGFTYYSSYLGYMINEIGDYAFAGTGLKSVMMPDSISIFGTHVYEGCTSLESYEMNMSNLTGTKKILPAYTFYGCTALKEAPIPSWLDEIGEYAYYGCNTFVELNIPDKITSIGANAFNGCNNITGLTIGANISNINNVITSKLLKEVTINDNSILSDWVASYVEDCEFNMPNLVNLEWGTFGGYRTRAKYTVRDRDFTIATFTSESMNGKLGYFSIDNTLYYKTEDYAILIKYYNDDNALHLLDCYSLGLGSQSLLYLTGDTLDLPSNILFLADKTELMYGVGFDTIKFNSTLSGITNIDRSILLYGGFNHVELYKEETVIPRRCFSEQEIKSIVIPQSVIKIEAYALVRCPSLTSVTFEGYNDELVVDLNAVINNGDRSNINSDFHIYVDAEYYNAYFEKFKHQSPLLASYLKIKEVPELGYINLLSAGTFSNGASVKVGDIDAKQIYDGSFRFESESGNTNFAIYVNGEETSIGNVGNTLTEFILGDAETTSIFSFEKRRTNLSSILTSVKGSWVYDELLGGIVTTMAVADANSSHVCRIQLPVTDDDTTNWSGKTVTVRFGLETLFNTGFNNYGTYPQIFDTTNTLLIKMQGLEYQSTEYDNNIGTHDYDAYKEVQVTVPSDGILCIYLTAAGNYQAAYANYMRGINSFWIKDIYLNDATNTYPDVAEGIKFILETGEFTSEYQLGDLVADYSNYEGETAVTATTRAELGGVESYNKAIEEGTELPDAALLLDMMSSDYASHYTGDSEGHYYLSSTLDEESGKVYAFLYDGTEIKSELLETDEEGIALSKITLEYNNRR